LKTSHEILERTIVTIDAHGEAAVRVQELADTVGVAVTSLYHFYGNREGLVEAAQAERYARGLREHEVAFTYGVRACRTALQFKKLIRDTAQRIASPEAAEHRMTLVNALGSAHGRPRLAAAIATEQSRFNSAIAAVLAEPQRKGWLRADLDLTAFVAWYVGTMLSRSVLDVGATGVDSKAWDRLTLDATMSLLFGPA
jgi:AcrR family transcriptional regulator